MDNSHSTNMQTHHKAPILKLRLNAPPRTAGFSLVEVLVSIVVLTFGMLGMVGMQAAALQANREARLQSAELVFAREAAEMIRGTQVEGLKPTATNPYIGAFTSPLTPTTASTCMRVAAGTTECLGTSDIAND